MSVERMERNDELATAAIREGTHRPAVDDFGNRYLIANLNRSTDPTPLRAAAEWLLREPPASLTEHEQCVPKHCPVAALRSALSVVDDQEGLR